MARFRLLSSTYSEASGKKYRKGDIVESSLDLDKQFVNKFVRLGASQKQVTADKPLLQDESTKKDVNKDLQVDDKDRQAAAEAGKEGTKAAKTTRQTGDENDPTKLGTDVSDEFEGTGEQGVKVFKSGRSHYTVVDAKDSNNTRGEFENKKDTIDWLKKAVK